MNSLKEIYQEHIKEERYQKYHQIIFKVDLGANTHSILDENVIVENLKILQIIDWMPFLNKIGLVVEDYYVRFMINSCGQYFIKLSIVYPSISTILEYKNSLCILPECNQKIFNYWSCFCQYHSSKSELINDTTLINQYFEKRSEELKNLHDSYQKQENLVHYLKTQFNEPTFEIKNTHIDPNISCHLTIVYDTSNLTDIDLEDDLELDQYIFDSTINNDDDLINHSTLEDILELFDTHLDNESPPFDNTQNNLDECENEPMDLLDTKDDNLVVQEGKLETKDEIDTKDDNLVVQEGKLETKDEIDTDNLVVQEEELETKENNLVVQEEELETKEEPNEYSDESSDESDNEFGNELDNYLDPSDPLEPLENDEMCESSPDLFGTDSELSENEDMHDISKEELEEMIAELAKYHLRNMKGNAS
uniref:Uncharacterized protein n=1 Tax=viral metagenome TaxID=1070528 RepID=A0A6C0E6E9_9ZZZZ